MLSPVSFLLPAMSFIEEITSKSFTLLLQILRHPCRCCEDVQMLMITGLQTTNIACCLFFSLVHDQVRPVIFTPLLIFAHIICFFVVYIFFAFLLYSLYKWSNTRQEGATMHFVPQYVQICGQVTNIYFKVGCWNSNTTTTNVTPGAAIHGFMSQSQQKAEEQFYTSVSLIVKPKTVCC